MRVPQKLRLVQYWAEALSLSVPDRILEWATGKAGLFYDFVLFLQCGRQWLRLREKMVSLQDAGAVRDWELQDYLAYVEREWPNEADPAQRGATSSAPGPGLR
jgi:hypothetical protein